MITKPYLRHTILVKSNGDQSTNDYPAVDRTPMTKLNALYQFAGAVIKRGAQW